MGGDTDAGLTPVMYFSACLLSTLQQAHMFDEATDDCCVRPLGTLCPLLPKQ